MRPFHKTKSGPTLYHGDMLAVLRTLPADSIDTVITDPPYHLTNRVPDVRCCTKCRRVLGGRDGKPDECPKCGGELGSNRALRNGGKSSGGFMGKSWDGGDIAFRPETWAAVLRVAKPGAMLLAFGGSRTFHRMACAIEDAGWQLRDTIMWIYGQGFPKSLDISKSIDKANGDWRGRCGESLATPNRAMGTHYTRTAKGTPIAAAAAFSGYGTALKPAFEPIIVAMKPLDGTFAQNAQKWGVAGLNIDGGRIGTDPHVNFPSGSPGGNSVRLQDHGSKGGDGRNLKIAMEYAAASKMRNPVTVFGRFPANVMLDQTAAALLDEQTLELKGGTSINHNAVPGSHSGNTIYHPRNVATQDCGYGDSGGASRFFYTAKASASERGDGNTHPTVKPMALMKYLCELTQTPTGGVVLDPFAGSGTTLLAAAQTGRPCIGIELEKDHCKIIVKRLSQILTPCRKPVLH